MKYLPHLTVLLVLCTAAKPMKMPAATGSTSDTLAAVAPCASDAGMTATNGPAGSVRVVTPDGANISYANYGETVAAMVGTVKGTEKADRKIVRAAGAKSATELWSCAVKRAAIPGRAGAGKKAGGASAQASDGPVMPTFGGDNAGLSAAEIIERHHAQQIAGGIKMPGEVVPDDGGADEPNAEKPGAEKPGAEKPGAEKPGAEKPGAEKPASEKPGAEKPGTTKPGTERPTRGPDFAAMEPCARLVACNTALAEELCKGADKCEFELKVSGNDPKACTQAMTKVDDMLRMARMMKPGLKKPAACP